MVDRSFYEALLMNSSNNTNNNNANNNSQGGGGGASTSGDDDLASSQGREAAAVAADLMSGEFLALLPSEFAPTKWDVICQRGKECFEHGTCVSHCVSFSVCVDYYCCFCSCLSNILFLDVPPFSLFAWPLSRQLVIDDSVCVLINIWTIT